MKIFTNIECAHCHKNLSSWTANTCTQCGSKICGKHAQHIRYAHKYVLSSLCCACAQTEMLSTQQEPARTPAMI